MYPVYRNKYRNNICEAFQEVWVVKMTRVMWMLPWKYSPLMEVLTFVNKYSTSWTWTKTRPFFSNDYLEGISKTSTPCVIPTKDSLVTDKRGILNISY